MSTSLKEAVEKEMREHSATCQVRGCTAALGPCLAGAVEVAVRMLEPWKSELLNLAAVLHHDGGHWMTREMAPGEIVEDCIRVWSNDVKVADAKVYELEKVLAEQQERLDAHHDACSIDAGEACPCCHEVRYATQPGGEQTR